MRALPKYWDNYFGGRYKPEYEVDTGVSAAELGEITTEAHDLSGRFSHPPQGQEVA